MANSTGFFIGSAAVERLTGEKRYYSYRIFVELSIQVGLSTAPRIRYSKCEEGFTS